MSSSMDTPALWTGAVIYIVILTILAVMASIAVGLRFWARTITEGDQHGLHADDWLSLAAILVNHGFTASLYIAFSYGLGASILELIKASPAALAVFAKVMFD